MNMPKTDNLEEIRRYVDQQLPKEKGHVRLALLVINWLMFVAFTILAVVLAVRAETFTVNLSSQGNAAFGALMLALSGYLTALIFHTTTVFLETKAGERQLRRRIAMRGVIRQWTDSVTDGSVLAAEDANSDEPHKPKRDAAPRAVRLAEDGELVPAEAEKIEQGDGEVRYASEGKS
jgi:hypothetical protein